MVGTIRKHLRLFAALALFIAWMGYLGYAALTRSHSPIVSHAQAAASEVAIVAEVEAGEEGKPAMKAKVVLTLTPRGPQPGTLVLVPNLPEARGYEGPGKYLLLLYPETPPYYLVGQVRSPGNDPTSDRQSTIYPWSEDVRKQYDKLHR